MMATSDETFNPAALSRSDTITSTTAASKGASISTPKQTKATQNFPRIDLEPLYSDLKDAIGHKWDTYYDAVTRFIRGDLHSREFGDLCDEMLYTNDNVLHLHNKFICAIAFNSARDNPDPGVAAWVSAASDKTSGAASGKAAITSDTGEQRLKKEVMAIPARDRRRLKGINNEKVEDDAQARRNQYEDSYAAGRIRVPDVAAPSAGSLTKTNWELEIKKRYQQPLFTESSEFPEATAVFARMVPICYEESIPQGSSMQCAELVATSAEFFFKEFLGTVFNRVRSNGPRYDNGVGGGMYTGKYKKQVEKELELVKSGKLQRTRDEDILPIESKVSKARQPLVIRDLKLANRVGPTLWNRNPLIGFEVENKPTESDYDEWRAEHDLDATTQQQQQQPQPQQPQQQQPNGHAPGGGGGAGGGQTDDDMDIDEDDFDWDGEGFGDRNVLDSLLDDCLKITA